MGSKNGKAGAVIDSVIEEIQDLGGKGLSSAQSAIKDADLADKVDRLTGFIEDNASVFATVAKRVAADVAKEGAAAAHSLGEAASAGLEAAGEALGLAGDSIEEEVLKPTMRYGRGLRHGFVIGAVVAILATPWPGSVLRAKIKGLASEAKDIVDAFREGATEPGRA